MTTTTHDTPVDTTLDHGAEEPREHRLSDVVPAVVAVGLLFGLLMAGAFLLKEVAGLGLWLVGGA